MTMTVDQLPGAQPVQPVAESGLPDPAELSAAHRDQIDMIDMDVRIVAHTVTSPAVTGTGLTEVQQNRVLQAIENSMAPNTRRAYESGWNAWCKWCSENMHREMPAAAEHVGAYLADRAADGAKIATVRSARAAIGAAHRAMNLDDPTLTATVKTVMDGLARQFAQTQRQAQPLTYDSALQIVHSDQVNARDKAMVALLFMGGMRRSEVADLRWADVEKSSDGAGILVTVRQSKTNQNGDEIDKRYLKNALADAVMDIRPEDPDLEAQVIGLSAHSINRRFKQACNLAGLQGDYTAHSGRVGLATELVSRDASTTAVQHAGGWKTTRMVARYSKGVAAEQGAVARYL